VLEAHHDRTLAVGEDLWRDHVGGVEGAGARRGVARVRGRGSCGGSDVVSDMPGVCAASRASGLRWSCSALAVAALVIANASSTHAMVEQ
jgi:hypothetical protein